VEKDSTWIKNRLRETATSSLSGKASPDDALKSLDTLLARAQGLKRKLTEFADEEALQHTHLDARVGHLVELADMHTFGDVKYEAWSRKRLDRLLVDYLLRQGYSSSAEQLAEEKNMRDLVDVETFVQMYKIRDSLKAGDVKQALAWCQDNKKELRKMEVSQDRVGLLMSWLS